MNSNVDPFQSVRIRKNTDEPMLKRANVILQAITNLLEQAEAGADHISPIAYLGALLSAAKESSPSEDEQSLHEPAIMYLIGILTSSPHFPKAVLVRHREDITSVLYAKLQNPESHISTLKAVMTSLTSMLEIVSASELSDPSVIQMIQAMLVFALDPRPKVRKSAQGGIFKIFQANQQKLPQKVSLVLLAFAKRELKMIDEDPHSMSALYLCGLLKGISDCVTIQVSVELLFSVIPFLTRSNDSISIKKSDTERIAHSRALLYIEFMHAFEKLLKHPVCDATILSNLYQTFLDVLKLSPTAKSADDLSMIHSAEVSVWTCIVSALGRCHSTMTGECVLNASEHLLTLLARNSQDTRIMSKLFEKLAFILNKMPNYELNKSDVVQRYQSILNSILGYRFKDQMVHGGVQTISTVFSHHPRESFPIFSPIISQVFSQFLHFSQDNESFDVVSSLRKTLRTAIESFGLQNVLQLIHFDSLQSRIQSWILEIARKSIAVDTIETFLWFLGSDFNALEKWTLFPSFCSASGHLFSQGVYLSIDGDLSSLSSVLEHIFNNMNSPVISMALHGLSDLITSIDESHPPALNQICSSFFTQFIECGAQLDQSVLPQYAEHLERICKLTESNQVNQTFRRMLKQILQPDAPKSLLPLTSALISSLDAQNVDWMYKSIVVLVEDPTYQHDAYQLLVNLLNHHADNLNHDVMADLDFGGTKASSCTTTSIVRLRLKLLLLAIPKNIENKQKIAKALGELILAAKASAQRTREVAFDVLKNVTKHFENLQDFIFMIAGGLSGSPHMQSGSVLCLASILFHNEQKIDPALITQMIEAVCSILRRTSREAVQAAIGFCKVAVSVVNTSILRECLPVILSGLMFWVTKSKNRFRQRIRVIFQILVRKIGPNTLREKVTQCDTSSDTTFIDAIIKSMKKQLRPKTPNQSEPFHRKESKFVVDDDFDLLDPSNGFKEVNDESDDEFFEKALPIDEEGRILVEQEQTHTPMEIESEDRPVKRAKKDNRFSGTHSGERYRSKKGKGDHLVAGAPEPFAFVGLQPSMLKRKNRVKASHQFDGIVRGAQKGSRMGKMAVKRKRQ